jgi:hypothetical protein
MPGPPAMLQNTMPASDLEAGLAVEHQRQLTQAYLQDAAAAAAETTVLIANTNALSSSSQVSEDDAIQPFLQLPFGKLAVAVVVPSLRMRSPSGARKPFIHLDPTGDRFFLKCQDLLFHGVPTENQLLNLNILRLSQTMNE